MGWWADRVLPRMIDRSCGIAPLRPLRARACAGLAGQILELGFGSGLNIDLYPDAVTEVFVVDPSDRAWHLSAERRAASRPPIRRVALDGTRIDLAENSVDAVLTTFTLCTVPDVRGALAEVRRVLRPGGALHLAEHGSSPDPRIARWQRRLEPIQRRVAGGCHLTRDVPALLAEAGFTAQDIVAGYVEVPALSKPWSYGYSGTARLP